MAKAIINPPRKRKGSLPLTPYVLDMRRKRPPCEWAIAHDKDAWAQSPGIVKPRPETAATYQAGYDRYLDTVASARALWDKSRLRDRA